MFFSGTTGALLLFDESLYQFCQTMQIDFLSTRVYIGLWLAVIGVGVACFEGSLFVKLFSRFVEDIFSSLIVLLYILESVQKVIYFYKVHPLLPNYCEVENIVLATKSNDFYSWNDTSLGNNTDLLDMENNSSDLRPIPVITRLPMTNNNGDAINQPNTALFCTILTLGTFGIAYYLRIFRNSQFFGRSVSIISNNFTVINISCKIVLFVIKSECRHFDCSYLIFNIVWRIKIVLGSKIFSIPYLMNRYLNSNIHPPFWIRHFEITGFEKYF